MEHAPCKFQVSDRDYGCQQLTPHDGLTSSQYKVPVVESPTLHCTPLARR